MTYGIRSRLMWEKQLWFGWLYCTFLAENCLSSPFNDAISSLDYTQSNYITINKLERMRKEKVVDHSYYPGICLSVRIGTLWSKIRTMDLPNMKECQPLGCNVLLQGLRQYVQHSCLSKSRVRRFTSRWYILILSLCVWPYYKRNHFCWVISNFCIHTSRGQTVLTLVKQNC